jgi:hypothetical protein
MRVSVAIFLLSLLIVVEAIALLPFVIHSDAPTIPSHDVGSGIATWLVIAISAEAVLSSALALRMYLVRSRDARASR